MYGIAAQTECLRKKYNKYNSKKHNKEWRSSKALAFGLRSKGHCLRCHAPWRRLAPWRATF